MSYTRSWTDNTPLDSDQASTLGIAGRNLRTDIHQRMDTLLGTGTNQWSTDPVWTGTGYLLYIPAQGSSVYSNINISDFAVATNNGVELSLNATLGSSETFYIPIILSPTNILTKVRALVFWTSGSTVQTAGVWKSNLAAGTSLTTTNLAGANVPSSTANWSWLDFGLSANYTIATADIILAAVNMTAVTTKTNVRVAGIEVTYNKPTITTTI